MTNVTTHRAQRETHARLAHGETLSRNLRRRIMAVLRMASRISIFGRGCKVGALGSAGAIGAVLAAIGVFVAGPAAASSCGNGDGATSGGSCAMGSYTPEANDGKVGATVVTGGDTVTLTTDGKAISMTKGQVGAELKELGQIDPTKNGVLTLGTGAKNQSVKAPDPTTNGSVSVATYFNSNMSTTDIGKNRVQIPVATGDGQYIDMRLGTAEGAGSTLHVNLGDNSTARANANIIQAQGLKQSHVVEANNGGTVIWDSKNYMEWSANSTREQDPSSTTFTTPTYGNIVTYKGTFTGLDGVTYTVNNLADLMAYNTAIIAKLQAGTLIPKGSSLNAQQAYDQAFGMAYRTVNEAYTYPANIDLNDDTAQKTGTNHIMYVDGAGSKGIVSSTGEINQTGASIAAVNGGNITVDEGGRVSGTYTQIELHSGSTATNNGVISGGYFANGNGDPLASNSGLYLSYAVKVEGTGSDFSNNGIINVASKIAESFAIQTWNGGNATNNGIINVAVNKTQSSDTGSIIGALVGNGNTLEAGQTRDGTFTNEGEIYIGRAAQYDNATAGADVDTSLPTYGIKLANGTATNSGTITIGSKSQNAFGMAADNNAVGTLTNAADGHIIVNGAAAAVPLTNIAMLAKNTTATVSNAGNILLNGVNGIGIKVFSDGNTVTRASSTGTITVAGGSDPASGTRNYGVWVEGKNAKATVDGAVNLTGEGAIGVHARVGGNIDVQSQGSVNFVSGSDQIGIFVNGAGSQVTNSASVLDVSTLNSTLFLLENGASFTGANSSTLIGSGQSSIVVRVRDAGSKFVSGATTINLTGKNAIGVYAEGGATASISDTATIHMDGVGVVAGIVDGQNHDITGAKVGTPVSTTSLTSAAQLNSSRDDVIGYIARNQAQFTNSGAINFTGAHATGVAVMTGATATNSGNIAIAKGGVGIFVSADAGALKATANNSGTITVNGSDLADRTIGVLADGVNAVANMQDGSKFTLAGKGAIGAQVLNGATINIVGSALPDFTGTDGIAFHAVGAGSTIASSATSLDANGTNATMFRIENGASLNSATPLTTSGTGSVGINATGSAATVNLTGGALNVTGTNSTGLLVEGGASGTIKAGVTASLSGSGASIGISDGQKHGLSGAASGAANAATKLTNLAAITTDGSNGTAFIARNQGVIVNQAAITLNGSNATAAHVQSGGLLDNKANMTVANGTGILLEGAGSRISNAHAVTANDGIAALALQNGASLELTQGQYRSAGTAHAVLVGAGTTGLNTGAVTLTTNGVGNGIENAGELAGIGLTGTTINVNGAGSGIRTASSTATAATANINANGANSTGYQFQRADGSSATGDLNLGAGYVINAVGAASTGVTANTAGAVELNNVVHVSGAGATGLSLANASRALIGGQVDVAADGGSALRIAMANPVVLTGSLASASSVAVVDMSAAIEGGEFASQGNILAASASHLAIQGSEAADTVTLAGGSLTGIIATAAGDDSVTWAAGTINGSIELGAGNDSLTIANRSAADLATVDHLDAGAPNSGDKGDVLTFSNVQYKGGTFAADNRDKGINLLGGWDVINLSNGSDWTLTDKLTLDDPEINIDATSSLRAGNGVLPVISASGGAVTLSNAGLIDLTNGTSAATDSLTLEGTYVGQAGTIAFETALGDDMSATDRFVVKGDTSGNSKVTVTNASGTGAMTNEGIEIITISGASNGSFDLVGDYDVNGKGAVVAGAYAYMLYQGNRTGTESKNWYLRTEYQEPVNPIDPVTPAEPATPLYQAGVPSYEAYPQALLGLNGLGTLQQRVGNRFWSGKGNRVVAQGADAIATPYAAAEDAGSKAEGNGVWGRIEGAHDHIEPRSSTAATSFDQNRLKMQAGIDGLLGEQDNGSLIGGLFVHHTSGKTKTSSKHGDGEISTDGYGLGGTLTWYGDNGLYVDGQAQVTWYQSDLNSTLARRGLTDGNDGIGYALSLESGKRFALNDGWSVTPQAQLSWSGVDFDSFTDTFGASVSLDRGNSLQGRLGITLDHEASWQNENGLTDRAHVYGIANLYNEFLDGTRVDVAGVSFASKQDRLWGGLGLGGSYNWNDDKYSIYGEGLVNTSLTSFGDSYSVKGNAGFRVKW